jgi:arsenate reductase
MAEAIVNHYLGNRWEAYSAGSDPKGVNPFTIRALKELGIEIPGARSKRMDVFYGRRFDRVFTLCDEARESCPIWPGTASVEHLSFPDPSIVSGSELERLETFRNIRDRLRQKILPLLSDREDQFHE